MELGGMGLDCNEIKVVKKDGTREDFNVQKVVVAVNKSANRAMITFTQAEINFICQFVEEKAAALNERYIPIAQMHNLQGYYSFETNSITISETPKETFHNRRRIWSR